MGNRTGCPCDKVAKTLADLCSCPSGLWQVGLVPDEVGYLAEETSKQSIEDAAWVLLIPSSEVQEERQELKKELLNKKESKLE